MIFCNRNICNYFIYFYIFNHSNSVLYTYRKKINGANSKAGMI